MKTLTKVAIGCGVAIVLAGTAAVAVMVGGAYWLKGKVEKVAGNEQKIEDLKKRAAAAAPFTRPADGVATIPRNHPSRGLAAGPTRAGAAAGLLPVPGFSPPGPGRGRPAGPHLP